jgi:hypothetical protein
MDQRREELRMLLGSKSLKAALEAYLAAQQDPEALRLFRFHQEVVELQACSREEPLTVCGRVTKVIMWIRTQSISLAHACV